jgi:hypothetical protein
MTSAQIEALLVNAPAAATAADNNAANAAFAPAGANSVISAPRLRITSNSGRSLRVQNYLFDYRDGKFIEASGSQGVDFEGNLLRAPSNDGQYTEQDANSGINLQ